MAEEIEVEVHADDELVDDEDSQGASSLNEERKEFLKQKRKLIRGKITRAINRILDLMKQKELVKRRADKEISDLRKDYDVALELHGELYEYEYEVDQSRLNKWEADLTRDIHSIEMRVEDYLVSKEQRKTRRTYDIEEDNQIEEAFVENDPVIQNDPVVVELPLPRSAEEAAIDTWIDNLVEFKETVLEVPTTEMSIADALYRLEASRDIPCMKLKKFDGDPQHYVEFIDAFRIHIHNKLNLSDDLRMVQLKMHLTGDAERSVSGLGSGGIMYATALKTLKEQYGQRSLIARSHISKLTRGDKIRSSDRQTLRMFYIDVVNCIATVKRINFLADVNSSETLRQIVKRFPDNLLTRWKGVAANIRESGGNPNIENICEFLRKSVKAEFDPDFGDIERRSEVRGHFDRGRGDRVYFDKRRGVNAAQTRPVPWRRPVRCNLCDENHRINDCPTFLDSSIPERVETIKSHKLCFSYLNRGHSARDCRTRKACGKHGCTRTHHILIHMDPPTTGSASVLDKGSMMPVVRVRFRTAEGRVREGNVLIDGGAGTTIIRKGFSDLLGLQGKRERLEISVVGGKRHEEKDSKRVKFWISPVEGGEEFQIEAHELDKTVLNVPPLDRAWLASFDHLKDVSFSHKAGTVDLILGVQFSHLHAEQEIREGLHHQPVAKRTRLGWCVIGPDSTLKRETGIAFCRRVERIDIERMYDLETIGVQAPNCECPSNVMSKEDKKALELMEASCEKQEDRYIMGLPWKRDSSELPNNYALAEKRLESLERSLMKNPEKAEMYKQVMKDYVNNGWAEVVQDKDINISTVYYLPHHGVYRQDKASTPLRVVFDPACTFQGLSLNSFLYKGPSLLGYLLEILIRFREKNIAFQGDVAKMFLQIRLKESDTHVHRYLWRDLNQAKEPTIYRLTRVTFGDKPSPDMANFVMMKIAEEHKETHPDASSVLLTDRYMDDIIHSCDSPEEAAMCMREIDTILATGSFKIKKWYCSSPTADEQKTSTTEKNLKNVPDNEHDQSIKTLGVLWNSDQDTIHFTVREMKDCSYTKRSVLSKLSMLFDPLGLASAVTIRARIAMQDIWRRKELGWDDPLPGEMCKVWDEIFIDWQKLNNVTLERCLKPKDAVGIPELHVFADASTHAYGACAYQLWHRAGTEKPRVMLVASKSRVAPLKQLTIPRLELMAALIASRLARTIYRALRVKPEVHLWSDSQIVIRWLNSESSLKKAFVGVRIAEIQTEWKVSCWRFVPTGENPADDLSRGIQVHEIEGRWFYGPKFLREPRETWPQQAVPAEEENDVENRRPIGICAFGLKESHPFIKMENFSSWRKLKHVTAYCFRFIDVLQGKRRNQEFTEGLLPQEINRAEEYWIRESQKAIPNWKETCVELSPFVENDLIRVGGRVKHSPLSYDETHPLLLPGSSHITNLILREVHEQFYHAGVERTLSESRRKYWVLHGRNVMKSIVRSCTVCRKLRQPPHTTLMGDLPAERLRVFSPPFTTTGVDLFGPFFLKYGRNKRIKAWGALFTCATIRAVHLEIVESPSTESFIHALRRFVAHHGWPTTIISDNGASSVGTRKELRELVQEGRREIQDFSIQHKVKWIFTTPLSPHQGGIYESLIKQAKRAIQVAVGQQTLSWNDMSTVFAEVQSLLNSRPLGYCANDANDLRPLTPNHFLLGRASVEVPHVPFDEGRKFTRRLGFLQTLVTQFWQRFIKEYIPTLMQRAKWRSKNRQLRVGDIVLVVDYQAPRGKWQLARIIEVYPGKDSIVRNVKLKTQHGEYKRAVQRCCLILPDDT